MKQNVEYHIMIHNIILTNFQNIFRIQMHCFIHFVKSDKISHSVLVNWQSFCSIWSKSNWILIWSNQRILEYYGKVFSHTNQIEYRYDQINIIYMDGNIFPFYRYIKWNLMKCTYFLLEPSCLNQILWSQSEYVCCIIN